MADSIPGHTTLKETEEFQLTASGPDNNHGRFQQKATIKSTVTDAGNTGFTTTLRGGKVMAIKASDGLAYAYDADADDGTQTPVGILEKSVGMLDKDGTAVDRFTKVLTAGILKSVSDLLGSDKAAIAVLARIGFRFAQIDPHGSAFGVHFKKRSFKAADYTVLDADHGCMFIATAAANFTLPDLDTVGRGFQVFLYNGADANMVITAAANKIAVGDAGGALATTLTFSTANKKMGGQALMYADYASDGGALVWYAMFLPTAVTVA